MEVSMHVINLKPFHDEELLISCLKGLGMGEGLHS